MRAASRLIHEWRRIGRLCIELLPPLGSRRVSVLLLRLRRRMVRRRLPALSRRLLWARRGRLVRFGCEWEAVGCAQNWVSQC